MYTLKGSIRISITIVFQFGETKAWSGNGNGPESHNNFVAEPAAQPSFLSPFQCPTNSVPSLIFSVVHNKRTLQQVRDALIGQQDFRCDG